MYGLYNNVLVNDSDVVMTVRLWLSPIVIIAVCFLDEAERQSMMSCRNYGSLVWQMFVHL